MEVRNLSQFKKALKDGHLFVIAGHENFPERIGEVRAVNKMQSNGFYSVVYQQPNHPISQANHGRGSWLDFGKSENWIFYDNGIIENYLVHNGNKMKILTIQILDDLMEG